MSIYENVVIGNFLFGLGMALGARARTNIQPPVSINLLQQTPLDPMLGDALLQGSRAMRILEFKRAENSSQKEASKRRALEAILGNKQWKPLAELSRQVHWYIESSHSVSKLDFTICPYLDFEHRSHLVGPTFQEMISNFADELSSDGPSRSALFKQYLNLLILTSKKQSTGSGAMIVFMSECGELRYVAVEHFHELDLHLDKYHDLVRGRASHASELRRQEFERLQLQEKKKEYEHEIQYGPR
ncbi:hypothetical protein [Herbaspirillum camelliae]|uniref:hypothetical protein n=1 Tax=Herbaspirillum camelliae TaxID=1892903 RepID=UPI00094A11F6|nr:hypothetical protein [Herbaspirillum camelliae]